MRGEASLEVLVGVASIASGGGRRSPPGRLVMVDAVPVEARVASRGVSPSTERTLSSADGSASAPPAAADLRSVVRARRATRPRIWFLIGNDSFTSTRMIFTGI